MAGELRGDLFNLLLERCGEVPGEKGAADLVLVLGTSLAGMNADRLVASVSHRAQHGMALGAVICGLQSTPHDCNAELRVFGKIDEFMGLVAAELGLASNETAATVIARDTPHGSSCAAALLDPSAAFMECFEEESEVYMVPYDSEGHLLSRQRQHLSSERDVAAEAAPLLRLDLSEGARLRITAGRFAGDIAEVVGRTLRGRHWRLQATSTINERTGFKAKHMLLLGRWWVTEAVAGKISRLPVVPANHPSS